jgi:hypothetical protein
MTRDELIARDERIHVLHAEGLFNAEISRRIGGVGKGVVYASLLRMGLEPNARPTAVPKPPKKTGYKMSDERARARADIEMVRIACGRCGDFQVATLALGKVWFAAHVCGKQFEPPVEPPPYGAPLPERVQRPVITPRNARLAHAALDA